MGAELRHHRGTPPGLACVQADIQRTVDAGEIPLSKPRSACDATSAGWTRPRRCEYRQTTVQEPWGATEGCRFESCRAYQFFRESANNRLFVARDVDERSRANRMTPLRSRGFPLRAARGCCIITIHAYPQVAAAGRRSSACDRRRVGCRTGGRRLAIHRSCVASRS